MTVDRVRAVWNPTFWVPNQFIFAPNRSRLGARTRTESAPCWLLLVDCHRLKGSLHPNHSKDKHVNMFSSEGYPEWGGAEGENS